MSGAKKKIKIREKPTLLRFAQNVIVFNLYEELSYFISDQKMSCEMKTCAKKDNKKYLI